MKTFFVLITTFLFSTHIISLHAQAPKKKSVAVLEFQKSGGVSLDDAVTLSNRFRGLLVETKAFEVVEREKMNELLKAQDFNMSDACNTSECAVQVGQLLGVEAMIAGDIGKIGQTYTIDMRLIDVQTGKIIDTKRQNHKGEVDGLLEAMAVIAAGFAGQQVSGQTQTLINQAVNSRALAIGKQKTEAGKTAAAKKPVEQRQIQVPFLFSISSVPSNNWHAMSNLSAKNHLRSDFNSSAFTTYEGAMSLKNTPFMFGARVQFDNNVVGNIQRFSGSLVYKQRTMLNIETGNIEGKARWTGSTIPSLPLSFDLKQDYTNIDLVFLMGNDVSSYLGFGYSSLKTPVQLNTLKGIDKHGTAVYDPDFRMKIFSIIANVESIPTELRSSGFGIFAMMSYRFGLAVGTVSKTADKLAELMNSDATSTGRDTYHANLDYNLALGPRYGFDIGKVKVFLAGGYEIAGIFMLEEGFSVNTSPHKFAYEPIYKFFRSGLIFKTYIAF